MSEYSERLEKEAQEEEHDSGNLDLSMGKAPNDSLLYCPWLFFYDLSFKQNIIESNRVVHDSAKINYLIKRIFDLLVGNCIKNQEDNKSSYLFSIENTLRINYNQIKFYSKNHSTKLNSDKTCKWIRSLSPLQSEKFLDLSHQFAKHNFEYLHFLNNNSINQYVHNITQLAENINKMCVKLLEPTEFTFLARLNQIKNELDLLGNKQPVIQLKAKAESFLSFKNFKLTS